MITIGLIKFMYKISTFTFFLILFFINSSVHALLMRWCSGEFISEKESGDFGDLSLCFWASWTLCFCPFSLFISRCFSPPLFDEISFCESLSVETAKKKVPNWMSSLVPCNGSRTSMTWLIVGRSLGRWLRHKYARAAAFWAPVSEYWPSSLGSITRPSLRGFFRRGRAHSTRFASLEGRDLSTDFRPVSSSSSTTPKLYTSLAAVR